MAIDRVTGRFLDDARLAILFELVQDLLTDEGAELSGEAQDVRQVLSTVERPNDEVSIGVMELANRVGCTQWGVSELKLEFKAVVGGNGNGVKRDG